MKNKEVVEVWSYDNYECRVIYKKDTQGYVGTYVDKNGKQRNIAYEEENTSRIKTQVESVLSDEPPRPVGHC
jgi:hypothetical protein